MATLFHGADFSCCKEVRVAQERSIDEPVHAKQRMVHCDSWPAIASIVEQHMQHKQQHFGFPLSLTLRHKSFCDFKRNIHFRGRHE